MKLIKIVSTVVLASAFVAVAGIALAKVETVPGPWTISASQGIVFSCGGGQYAHTLNTVTQGADGSFTGTGNYVANPGYTWNITGNVAGNGVTFTIVYTGLNSGYTLNGEGTIDSDGSIIGTVDGNCSAFSMLAGSASRFEGNHGQYVSSQEDKQAAAQSRIGMPVQSKGHTK